MQYVYFTKLLKPLDLMGYVKFCKDVGLDGVDLTVRAGYPVNPDNVRTELPRALKTFRDNGLVIGMVSGPTNLTDATTNAARDVFTACGKLGITNVKIGYYRYRTKMDADIKSATQQLAGFAKLAKETGAKACYHTHSGKFLGGNAGVLRLMLQDLDPHHVGAFADTGHLALDGGPIQMELDLLRPWLSLLSIKDIAWEKTQTRWEHHVVPAGEGIVKWNEVSQALRDVKFNGTVTLHGEYHTKDLMERTALAKRELAFLKKTLPGKR